jgi:endoglucanase
VNRLSLLKKAAGLLVFVGLLVAVPAASAYYSGVKWPGDPLAGHPWFVDKTNGSWYTAIRENPGKYGALRQAADNPMNHTFGSFDTNPQQDVAGYVDRVQRQEPGAIAFVNLGRIEEGCPQTVAPAGFTQSEIEAFANGFSKGLGNHRAMVVVETDKLATIGCGTSAGIARHLAEIDYEVHLLHTNNPNAVVYIDAGASDWGHSPSYMANLLRKADIKEARGFVLGASHYDFTHNEDPYGKRISKLLGGVHFVVNTDENGWGRKVRPGHTSPFYRPGCLPPDEGLGYVPTTNTPKPVIDAYIWSGTPGYEAGGCIGQPNKYAFWPQLAMSLVKNANPPLPR